MARTVRNSTLEAKSNRLKLPIRREPYWQRISKGCHIGYRRLTDGNGTWIARYRPENGARTYCALGSADDVTDGITFAQAQEKARDYFKAEQRKAAGEFVSAGVYTVADAMRDYFADRERKRHKSVAIDRLQSEAHIIPALGSTAVEKLTKRKIVEWHAALADAPARKRSPAGEQRFRKRNASEKNSRGSTANRILAILKAALNRAHDEGRAPIADAWQNAKPFQGVDSARVAYLKEDEPGRLLNACQGDLRNLVIAGLLTGCRYGELTQMVVEDFHADAGTIHVRVSKSGKSRHVALTDEGQRFFARLCLGKTATDLLLTITGRAWKKANQQVPFEAARRAARLGPISFHGLRHTYASKLVMKGVPLAVVAAQLGHTSIAMVEKHYGHLAPNYVADTVRAALGNLGVVEPTNVTPLKPTIAASRR
jgi:integrase